jgi:hypothetical protein
MSGGNNLFLFSPNSTEWIDPLGLRAKRNRKKCPCEDKRTCEEIYKDALSTSIGKKKDQGSRGLSERIEHLHEDKLDLYRRAKSEDLNGKGGSLNRAGSWDGHVAIAQNLLENLQYDIEAYDSKGCGSSYKKMPKTARDLSRAKIPNEPSR